MREAPGSRTVVGAPTWESPTKFVLKEGRRLLSGYFLGVLSGSCPGSCVAGSNPDTVKVVCLYHRR